MVGVANGRAAKRSNMSEMPDDVIKGRADNVKTVAARVAAFGQGYSIREFLDALALAAGTLIRACYRGPGLEIATKSFIEVLIKTVQKG
jgi:hypothetical protein